MCYYYNIKKLKKSRNRTIINVALITVWQREWRLIVCEIHKEPWRVIVCSLLLRYMLCVYYYIKK